MSNTIEIRVPDIGDFTDVPVIEVLVAQGDEVKAEQSLITLESDKATMEVPSPQAGVIRELKLALNDSVSEGDLVAVLEVSGTENTEAKDLQAADSHATETRAAESTPATGEPTKERAGQPVESVLEPKTAPGSGEVPAQPAAGGITAAGPSSVPYASPAIRRFARELGVDLSRVSGSGSKGRILREDVSGFVKSVMSDQAPKAAGIGPGFEFPPLPDVDFSRYGDIEIQALTRIQKISSGHLHRNWVGIPHVTQHDEADITDMEAFRKANTQEALAAGFKLTPLVFLIKASVAALKKFPSFNASLDKDGENLVLKRYFNIGIAVDTPEGLIVPVIRECERKGIMELAGELAQVSERAREKKLTPQDIQGGCFTISSLGGIGGTSFTPIINAPEVAILGVSRSRMQPVWDGHEFKPRLMLPLSVSYDHRVIDGANAARFTRYLASRLEDLRRLTL